MQTPGHYQNIWALKDSDTPYSVKWAIHRKESAYTNKSRRCNLCLAEKLASSNEVEQALKAYEDDRLETTAEIVRTNRSGGPERVIDMVNARAPDGFENLHDVATHEELEGVVKGYSNLAGFSQEKVNVAQK